MGVLIDFSERGGDVRRFDEGLKMAKSGLMEVCDIWEDMKHDFNMRGGYSERYSSGGGYSSRDNSYHSGGSWAPSMSERDWNELQERRRRDGMGRFY